MRDAIDVAAADVLLDEAPDEFEPVDYEVDNLDTPEEFGDMTQHMLLSYLSSNLDLWIKCAPVLREDYFDNEFRPVIACLKQFERDNHLLPSKSLIQADTGIRLETPEDATDPRLVKVICDRVEEYCLHRAVMHFLIDSADAINNDRSRATAAGLAAEMDRIVSSISIQPDLGFDVFDDFQAIMEDDAESDPLPTGFDLLDRCLDGGVASPSLNLVSADSGQGKSMMLANLAVNYSRQGHNVVYVSLELSKRLIQKRFAAIITGTPINSIHPDSTAVMMKLKRMGRTQGKIKIQCMPGGTTVADIRAFVSDLSVHTGLQFQHVIIDYLDLVDPVAAGIRSDNIHLREKAIAEELTNWAKEPGLSKTLWTASQQTKGAGEEARARASAVSGSVYKVNTCDNLLIMKRSEEDKEEDRTWVTIQKTRTSGGQGKRVPFRWDPETQRLSSPPELEDLFIEANTPKPKEGEGKDAKKSVGPLKRDVEQATSVSALIKRNSKKNKRNDV